MEPKCSSAVAGENNIGKNNTGFVCQYQFEDGSSQLVFLQANKANGAFGVKHSLSFSTHSYVQVNSSCKGLLLLSSVGDQEVNYHVFNPISKHSVTLPQPAGITGQIITSGLAYDDDRYHVVLVHAVDTNQTNSEVYFGGLELTIFSSETGGWRRHSPTDMSIPIRVTEFEFPELRTPPIFSNGAIHWEISGHLLSYWVKDDNCELVELPNFLEDWCWQSTMTYRRCLWESNDRVHYCYTGFEGVHTWVLLNEQDHDYYSRDSIYDRKRFRWALENSVNRLELLKFWHRESCFHLGQLEPYDASPLALADDSETMYLQLPGCMISYNTRTRVIQEACSYTYPGIYSNCCLFFPYDYGSQFLPEIASASLEQEAAELPVKERLNTVSF